MKRFVILTGAVLLLFGTNCASAGWLFGDLLGLDDDIDNAVYKMHGVLEHGRRIIDYTLDKSNAMVTKHLQHADDLERRTVEDINNLERQAVKDIKEIEEKTSLDIDSKIIKINKIVECTITKVNILEQKTIADFWEVIKEAECIVDRVLLESLKIALGNVGEVLNTHTVRIYSPLLYSEQDKGSCFVGFCFGGSKTYQDFEIHYQFYLTYDSIKEYLLDNLKNIRPDTPIESLVQTYSTISKLARQAICLHPDMKKFAEDYVLFRDKSLQVQKFIERQEG